MKKFFTSVALALTAMSMQAKDYTCPLTVNVSGSEMPCGETTVSVDKQANGKYTLGLKNFSLMGFLNVGTILVKDVDAEDFGNTTVIKTQQTIQIAAGDLENVKEEDYLGPQLGDVPILLHGELKNDKFNAVLNINMAKLGGMNVGVQLGDIEGIGQFTNSGFEDFHEVTLGTSTSQEPNGWHSFMSASGQSNLVNMAGKTPHTFISKDVRPGTSGTNSVKVTAKDMFFAIANGTITTGRMNAGSATATDTDKNYAWCDWTKTDMDANGDPFYTIMTGKPDSLKVWIKYGQGNPKGTKAKDHPYATISSIITDGTELHEPAPQKTTYTNIVGEARNPKIASTNGEWKEITIPFEYEKFKDNKVTPRTILTTISTNADAGMGSDNDSILVDDISLIYNADLTSIKYKGKELTIKDSQITDGTEGQLTINGEPSVSDFEMTSNGAGAYTSITLVPDADENGNPLNNGITNGYVTVTSNDLKSANVYYLTIKSTTTGIKNAQTITLPAGVQAIYNLAGQQVSNMTSGQVYIVKTTDGKTKKVIKK